MLTRATTAVFAGIVIGWTLMPSAFADDGPAVQCPPNDDTCIVTVADPGTPSHGTGSGDSTPPSSGRVCYWPTTGEPMDCHGRFGWWSERDQCFYQRVEPPPAASEPEWAGHYPDGAIYAATCPGAGGPGGGWVWFADPPTGYGGGGLTPGQLADRAVRLLPITGPVIGMAPRPAAGSSGLVGLPVWMWTAATPAAWGPVSATASVPGMSVTATARAVKVEWDMGDGHAVTCTSPGTPYTPGLGDRMSPTCGYRYTVPSTGRPGGVYTVTATTTWQVTWTGAGASGRLTTTRASSVRVRIGELQVLIT